MKKILSAIFITSLVLGTFSSCKEESNRAEVNIGILKGPSSIGMVNLMDEADNARIETNDFTFQIAASAEEIIPKLVQGEIDIAAVPANLSSVLYNNTEGQIKVIAISTLGMMYVVEKGTGINSIEDLRGKTIYAGFKGNSPEYDLNYILKGYGIDPENDLTIEWKSEHAECVAALLSNENAIAILPQPFATTAQMQDENIKIALDLNLEWEKLQATAENPSALITGVVIARSEFIDQNPNAVTDFLNRYNVSIEFAKNNVNETAALIGKYEIFPEEVAKKAIPYCNITFIKGEEMKSKLTNYLGILFEQNPQSIGGTLPDEKFYFVN